MGSAKGFPAQADAAPIFVPDYGGSLPFRIWVTRGCYFTMADRLRLKARYSVVSITLLSFYVVVVSLFVIAYVDQIPDIYNKLASVTTVVLSIFIIIITLMESSRNFTTDAEHAFEIGHRLESLFNSIDINDENLSTNPKIQKKYDEILHDARLKYLPIDYRQFKIDHSKSFNFKKLEYGLSLLGYLVALVGQFWLYAIMSIGPLIVLCLLGFIVVTHLKPQAQDAQAPAIAGAPAPTANLTAPTPNVDKSNEAKRPRTRKTHTKL